jgi:hypothetical protein
MLPLQRHSSFLSIRTSAVEVHMSEIQNSLTANNAEPTSAKSTPNDAYGLAAAADSERREELGMDNEADLGGHTLLSRPQAPQGRRSLFRR